MKFIFALAAFRPRWSGLRFSTLALTCFCLTEFRGHAQWELSPPARLAAGAHRDDRILIKPGPGIDLNAVTNLHSAVRGRVLHHFESMGRLQVVEVPRGQTVEGLLQRYRQSGLVEFAQPDYLVQAAAITPNDPKYLDGTLWGLHNTGQSGGTPDADIDAPEAWGIMNSASNIVVAVLDTGVRATHEDLAANMWVNPRDGSHGINTLTGTTNSSDDQGHGTLVSGIVGGVGNNGKGVVGVAWKIQIMACKGLDASGVGSDSTLIGSIDFARTNGAKIIVASLDSPTFSEALSNAVRAARNDGVIFVASAGNNGVNIDLSPRYPAAYDLDNVLSVAYTTRSNSFGRFSNSGVTNVDLAAPGAGMHSCFFTADNAYLGGSFLEGTSFAAPYVAGACALVMAKYPNDTYRQVIDRVLRSTEPVSALSGKCATGGLLNLKRALDLHIRVTLLAGNGAPPGQLRVISDPNQTCVVEVSNNLMNWSPVFTNTTSAGGTFDYVDPQAPSAVQRFYRAVSVP